MVNISIEDENNKQYRDACKCFENQFIEYMRQHDGLDVSIRWAWAETDNIDDITLYSFKVKVDGRTEECLMKMNADGEEWRDFMPSNQNNINRNNVLRSKAMQLLDFLR